MSLRNILIWLGKNGHMKWPIYKSTQKSTDTHTHTHLTSYKRNVKTEVNQGMGLCLNQKLLHKEENEKKLFLGGFIKNVCFFLRGNHVI